MGSDIGSTIPNIGSSVADIEDIGSITSKSPSEDDFNLWPEKKDLDDGGIGNMLSTEPSFFF